MPTGTTFRVGDTIKAVSRRMTDNHGLGFERLNGLISEGVVMTVKEFDGEIVRTPYYSIHKDDVMLVSEGTGPAVGSRILSASEVDTIARLLGLR